MDRIKVTNLCLDLMEMEIKVNRSINNMSKELGGQSLGDHIEMNTQSAWDMLDKIYWSHASEYFYDFLTGRFKNKVYTRYEVSKVDNIKMSNGYSIEIDESPTYSYRCKDPLDAPVPQTREEMIEYMTLSAGLNFFTQGGQVLYLCKSQWNGIMIYNDKDGNRLVHKWFIPNLFPAVIENDFQKFEDFKEQRLKHGFPEDMQKAANEEHSKKEQSSQSII